MSAQSRHFSVQIVQQGISAICESMSVVTCACGVFVIRTFYVHLVAHVDMVCVVCDEARAKDCTQLSAPNDAHKSKGGSVEAAHAQGARFCIPTSAGLTSGRRRATPWRKPCARCCARHRTRASWKLDVGDEFTHRGHLRTGRAFLGLLNGRAFIRRMNVTLCTWARA